MNRLETPQPPNYDFHLHTHYSDGVLAPAELIQLCCKRDIKLISITDHDSVAGVDSSISAAADHGIRVIPGAEFTASWKQHTLHILGLGLNHHQPELVDYCNKIKTIRLERAEKIAHGLIKKGVVSSIFADSLALAGQGQICRPHFAQALVNHGYVNSLQSAFDRYLKTGKAGAIKTEWPDISSVIKTIQHAQGYSILAHPTKYHFSFSKIRTLLQDLKSLGCDGIEISYPGMKQEYRKLLKTLADQHQFMTSAGSDFHSPEQTWRLPGVFDKIPIDDLHILNKL